MTHTDLVKRAEKWLRGTMRCSVVLAELSSAAYETPDAIGWTSVRSILVECKTSKSDFARGQKKHFRQNPEYGMGDFRFYMTPPGLLSPDEIPEHWGLLEARPKQTRIIVEAKCFDRIRAAWHERTLLVSALRRLQEAG